jgi:hypothetical protein
MNYKLKLYVKILGIYIKSFICILLKISILRIALQNSEDISNCFLFSTIDLIDRFQWHIIIEWGNQLLFVL